MLGGAGSSARTWCDALVERGHQVRVLDALVPQVHGAQPYGATGLPRYVNLRGRVHPGRRGRRPCPAARARRRHGGLSRGGRGRRRPVDVRDGALHAGQHAGHGRAAGIAGGAARRRAQAGRGLVYVDLRRGRVRLPGARPGLPAACGRRRNCRRAIGRCAARSAAGPPRPRRRARTSRLFPTSIYAINKRDQEEMCLVAGRAYGIPTVALRYFNVYGTRQSLSNPYTGVAAIFSARLLNDKPPLIFEDGRQRATSSTSATSCAPICWPWKATRADYEALNMGTGHVVTVSEVARTLAQGLGKEITPEIVSQFRAGDIAALLRRHAQGRAPVGLPAAGQLRGGHGRAIGLGAAGAGGGPHGAGPRRAGGPRPHRLAPPARPRPGRRAAGAFRIPGARAP